MRITPTFGLLTVALATVLVSACGGPDTPAAPAPTSSPAASADHNQADITFVQGMIPHHEQAVAMSELAANQASSPQVIELAATIERAQAPEIEQMRAMLTTWGVAEDSSMGGTPHGGTGADGMPGMMTDEQMHEFQQATGDAFDRMFLQMMIIHHEGAVAMARTELSDGQNPQAKALAQTIIDQQTTEIAQMRELLQTL
jgi:uncharacterized protein (DUF305 family)